MAGEESLKKYGLLIENENMVVFSIIMNSNSPYKLIGRPKVEFVPI